MKTNTIPQVVSGRFSLIRRTHGVYFSHNKITGQRQSLRTRDKRQAVELLNALNANDADRQHCEELAQIYQRKAGRTISKKAWQEAMEECANTAGKAESTRERHRQAFKGKDFKPLLAMPIHSTHADHFRQVLKSGKPSVAKYLRKLQGFAIAQGWLTIPLLPSNALRVVKLKEKRAIKKEEYLRISEAETNPERKRFYQMLWATGAAQIDCANLRAENFNRETGVLTYRRKKTGCVCRLQLVGSLEALLKVLPTEGFLLPRLQQLSSSTRGSEFRRRCRTKALQIEGVTLHSFRYSWAERAAEAGLSIREAQAALGHRSEVVAMAYAKHAEIVCPSLPG